MFYASDINSSDEDGFSDDYDYYEFKERMKNKEREIYRNRVETEEEKKNRTLQTILSAITHGQEQVLLNELKNGSDVNCNLWDDWTPLLLSTSVSNFNITSQLLNLGADINYARVEDGFTPLMLSCNIPASDDVTRNNEILSCIQLLIDKGANVNAIDNKRRNALMLAAYNGQLEAVKLLLPITQENMEDNQRWTPLFWAVNGNRVEIVKYLFEKGFSCDKIDIRGDTPVDVARSRGFENILNLFPSDDSYNEFYIYLMNNIHDNFEKIFDNCDNNIFRPPFFGDICKILYGTRSERIITLIQENHMDLFDFLSVNDTKLKQMKIVLPYQRKRILGGLYLLHKRPFTPKSIPFIPKNQLITNIDVASMVLSCIRQLIIMEASLKFMVENSNLILSKSESQTIQKQIKTNEMHINRLKVVAMQFYMKAKNWDSTLKSADRITKKRLNIPWCNLSIALSILSITIVCYIKYK